MAAETVEWIPTSELKPTNLVKCLETGKFSDFEIVCGEHVFHTHRIVLAAHSSYFDRMCSGDFKEAKDGRLYLDEESPALMARLIYFLYAGTYPITPVSKTSVPDFATIADPDAELSRVGMLHAKMYAIGMYYNIPEVTDAASRGFRSLYNKCSFNNEPEWQELAKYIYSSTPAECRDLRNIVVLELHYALWSARCSMNYSQLRDLIQETPDLAIDMAMTQLTMSNYKCSTCGFTQQLILFPCPHDTECAENAECLSSSLNGQKCLECHEGAEWTKVD